MEKDIAIGSASELKLELVGTDAVVEFDTVGGISVKLDIPAVALLVALNGAVDAKWPGEKAISDDVFGLFEKGVQAAGAAAAPAAAPSA